MTLRVWVTAVVMALSLLGCATGRTFPHRSPSEDFPHFAWELVVDSDGRDNESCASDAGNTSCLIQASTPERRRTATFSLILHGVSGRDTTYSGTYRLTFFDTPRAQAVEHFVPASPATKPVIVLGLVTGAAGEYSIEIDLKAAVGESHRPLRAIVPVTVRASATEQR